MSRRSRATRRGGMPALLSATVCLALTLALLPPGADAADEAAASPPREAVAPPSQQFDDVPLDHLFFADIDWLATEGIAQGRDDGTFGPTAVVTRGAVAAFLARYSGATPAACAGDPFPDVPAGHPFCTEIAWLAAEGITGGFPDGTFRPADPVSRQTMAAFLHRLAGPDEQEAAADCASPFADVPPDHPFCQEILWLVEAGVTEGFAATTFGPTVPVSRQAMAAFLHRLDDYESLPVPSPGCGQSEVDREVEVRVDLEVDAAERWYLRTVPSAHDGQTPLPLVVDFHGFAEGAEIHRLMSAFSPVAESEGFVVAFPQGTGNPVRWNVALDPAGNPDLVFVDALLDDLADDLCIDLSRIYAAGLSMGAFMSSTIACVWADRFAAAAPVAGILRPATCSPSRPVPMLSYHGTADTILPFNGGFGTLPGSTTTSTGPTTTAAPDLHGPGYPANVAAWAAGNGCDPVATDTQETDEVIRRVYDCPRHADVEFTIVLGGGHAWPGSDFSQAIAAVVGYTTFDAAATTEAWAFFQRHHR